MQTRLVVEGVEKGVRETREEINKGDTGAGADTAPNRAAKNTLRSSGGFAHAYCRGKCNNQNLYEK